MKLACDERPQVMKKPSASKVGIKKTVGKKVACYSIEKTRSQVMCRHGKGPGSTFPIKYGKGSGKTLEDAVAAAEAWVAARN